MTKQRPSLNDRILVVDDDRLNRVLLSTNLEEAGYIVSLAKSGREALALLEEERFDAVLLDLKMPDIDGYDVLRRMKEDETLRYIPVIVISALKDIDSIVQCIQMGAADHLPKPFNPVLLKARLDASLAQKRLHDAERAYLEELQIRNEELDAFAATVAHDLKNPLASVVGFAQLLQKTGAVGEAWTEKQYHSLLPRLINGSRRMQRIIDELLLLSRIRKEDVQLTEVDMGAIIQETLERMQVMLADYRPKIVVPESWPPALGYHPWIEEVWTNYLSNALKYGGSPPLVKFESARQENGMVRFALQDNGEGLTVEEQAKIFVPFTRLGQVRVEGQGLGLSIVHRIVTKLGGEVGVDSVVGQGSQFWFTLPEA